MTAPGTLQTDLAISPLPHADNTENVVLLFQKGGSVIPTQAPGLSTTAQRGNPITIVAALTKEVKETGVSSSRGAEASGTLFWDDGEQVCACACAFVYESLHGRRFASMMRFLLLCREQDHEVLACAWYPPEFI